MADEFNPYYKWLGIPPREQPANHYRLLGVETFEDDPDVIESAADQRMRHLRTFQRGKHAELSQQLLNEVAAAKVCLLNPDQRAEYDVRMRGEMVVAAPPPPPPPAVEHPREWPIQPEPAGPHAPAQAQHVPPPLPSAGSGGKSPAKRWIPAGLGTAAALVVVGLILSIFIPGDEAPPEVAEADPAVEQEEVDQELLAGDQPATELEQPPSDVTALLPEPSAEESETESTVEPQPPEPEAAEPAPPEPEAAEPEPEPPSAEQRALALRRAGYRELQQQFADEEAQSLQEHRKLPKFIDPGQTEILRRRDRVRGDLLAARLSRASALAQIGRTHPTGSDVYKDNLTAAAEEFRLLSTKYDDRQAGFYARIGEARCYRELGDTNKALKILTGMLSWTKGQPALRVWRNKAVAAALAILASPETNRYREAAEMFDAWQAGAEPSDLHSSAGVAAQYYAAVASLELAKKSSEQDDARRDHRERARRWLALVACSPGRFRRAAKARLLETLGEDGSRESSRPPRLPRPSDDRQRQIASRLDDAHRIADGTRTQRGKCRMAEKLYALAKDTGAPADERYVLLRRASELAAQGGDGTLALQAVDALAADFDLDAWAARAKIFLTFVAHATGSEQIKSLMEDSAGLIRRASDEGRSGVALELAEGVYRATVKPAGAEFRKEAYDRRAAVRALQGPYEEFRAALKTLEGDPDDASAQSTAGVWLCYKLGDWQRGLAHLSRGRDEQLKDLARRELASPPGNAEGQLELADAWWALATRPAADGGSAEVDFATRGMMHRAAYWYRRAGIAMKAEEPGEETFEQQLEELGRIRPILAQSIPETDAFSGGPFAGRGAARARLVLKYGGTPGSEKAVAGALRWLAAHQLADGGWSFDHNLAPGCKGQCSQPGSTDEARNAATGLALLPFLGTGETHQSGKYRTTVKNGLTYLVLLYWVIGVDETSLEARGYVLDGDRVVQARCA